MKVMGTWTEEEEEEEEAYLKVWNKICTSVTLASMVLNYVEQQKIAGRD